MQKLKALSVVPIDIKSKDGKPASTLYEVFVQADDGKIGSAFSSKLVEIGGEVALYTTVQDGKIRLKCQPTK